MPRNSSLIVRFWQTMLVALFRVPHQSPTRGGPLKRDLGGFSHAHLTAFKLPGE
jgi:hypothetical protein